MKNLLIIYHSQTGNTEQLAQAVLRGSQEESGVRTKMLKAFDTVIEDLIWADGLLFGTPENFGTMSGALKDFFDRTYYPAEPYKLNLPYATFVSAENDGSGAVRDIERIAKGYPLRKIAEPYVANGVISAEHLDQSRDFGHAMAAGLALGIF
ncbi:flavodoxin family protein [SAR92 clade bacterium H921]|jgi:multimeric flavodoxin WrbA|nr:flavodoxin family protein [SAR92 clade bacterium H921]MDA9664364.1 flavodoxin family protein [bacterium]MDG1306879.1 flavodoxin family protein [Porticoccaceae bacterium]